ncbi:unnamed protein product, partial [Polarella glacialis]
SRRAFTLPCRFQSQSLHVAVSRHGTPRSQTSQLWRRCWSECARPSLSSRLSIRFVR